jgi:hypothetical protein
MAEIKIQQVSGSIGGALVSGSIGGALAGIFMTALLLGVPAEVAAGKREYTPGVRALPSTLDASGNTPTAFSASFFLGGNLTRRWMNSPPILTGS